MKCDENKISAREVNSIEIDERIEEGLLRATDEVISARYGLKTRDTLHLDLLTRFSMRKDEPLYHLENLIPILEENLGPNIGPLSIAIGKRMFSQLQLEAFGKLPRTLTEYVDTARAALIEREVHRRPLP